MKNMTIAGCAGCKDVSIVVPAESENVLAAFDDMAADIRKDCPDAIQYTATAHMIIADGHAIFVIEIPEEYEELFTAIVETEALRRLAKNATMRMVIMN